MRITLAVIQSLAQHISLNAGVDSAHNACTKSPDGTEFVQKINSMWADQFLQANNIILDWLTRQYRAATSRSTLIEDVVAYHLEAMRRGL